MKSQHLPILLLAVGLGFLGYRSSTAAPGNACLATTFFGTTSSVQTVANNTGKGQAAPAWELKDLDGKAVKLSDFKGKVVLLNFWATWCPPCRDEIPALVALQNQYKAKGLVVIGVSLDQKGPAPVQAFVKRMKINYAVVMGDEKTVMEYGGVQAIPTTFYINREGNVASVHQGGADAAMFEATIKPLLEKPEANL